jgi:hypothetical protein
MGEGDKLAGAQKASDDPMMRVKKDLEFIPCAKARGQRFEQCVIVKVISRDEVFQEVADTIEITRLLRTNPLRKSPFRNQRVKPQPPRTGIPGPKLRLEMNEPPASCERPNMCFG